MNQTQVVTVYPTRRRQHHSCDQCRKGKRACDATVVEGLYNTGHASTGPILSKFQAASDKPIAVTGPCSNCKRWKKECTFEWLQTVGKRTLQQRQQKEGITATSPAPRRNVAPPSGSQSQPPALNSYITPPNDSDLSDDRHSQTSYLNIPSPLSFKKPSSTSDDAPEKMTPPDYSDGIPSYWEAQIPEIDAGAFDTYPIAQDAGVMGGGSVFQPIDAGLSSAMPGTANGSHFGSKRRRLDRSNYTADTEGHNSTEDEVEISNYQWSPGSLVHRNQSALFGSRIEIAPWASSQNLAERVNRAFMTRNLLRIYHDSMENALSCWLTERNCPYSGVLTKSNGFTKANSQASMASEWGPNWSNRVCTRVCRLDRSYSAIRGGHLTKAEDQAASRALHTAIMAFAAQWAQAGQRSVKRTPALVNVQGIGGVSNGGSSHVDVNGSQATDHTQSPLQSPEDFGRSIQQRLWEQASRAIHDSAGIESFRVMFAQIIFSLTQRPLDITRHAEAIEARRSRHGSSPETQMADFGEWSSTFAMADSSLPRSKTASDWAKLRELMDSDEGPHFLETGVRRIFISRHKLERLQREKNMKSRAFAYDQAGPRSGNPMDMLSEDDQETFNLLFWLGVMFDTLTAAMHQRPPVVSDEDSSVMPETASQSDSIVNDIDLDGWDHMSDGATSNKSDRKLWGDLFLHKGVSGHWRDTARWPCSYEEAATILSDAAPVKVLLFRRVSRLQTLVYRKMGPEALEDAIKETLRLYRYWNLTYGQFMRDCVAHHDNLPVRIQSWYVLLSGHWQLAVILLADTIEDLDKRGMGLKSQQELRQSSNLVPKLRRQGARAISDLARCSLHGQDQTFPKSRNFHDAVNDGALLTEPWTAVLIRSFSRAGYVLVDEIPTEAEEQSSPGRSRGVEEAKKRSEWCIDALWCLARKSDLALLAARSLTGSLEDRLREYTLNQAISDFCAQNGNFELHDYIDDFLTPFVGPVSG